MTAENTAILPETTAEPVPTDHQGIFEPDHSAEEAVAAEKALLAVATEAKMVEQYDYRGEDQRRTALDFATKLATPPSGAEELIKRATVIAEYLAGTYPDRVV